MSAIHAADENPISQVVGSLWERLREHLTESIQYFCLYALLSTYLLVILKQCFISNNKELGGDNR